MESGSEILKDSIKTPIEQPIEQKHTGKGIPLAIIHHGAELNNRQKELLSKLPHYDSRVSVPKDTVNMDDLAALTAQTGVEFAMFTKEQERLVIRGDERLVNITPEMAEGLNAQGYRWSGHTHPGVHGNCLRASDGDYAVLEQFDQEKSVIYNSTGSFDTFDNQRYF